MPTSSLPSSLSLWQVRASAPMASAVLCLALFVNFMLVDGHDHQRLVGIGTVLAGGAIALLATPSALAGLFAGRAGTALAAFFALGIAGAATAFSPRLAAFEAANLFLLYVLAVTVASDIARRGQAGLRLLLCCLGAVCASYICLFAVAYAGALTVGNPLVRDDFHVHFSNVRFFNHTQTLTLPLLILLCCLTRRASAFRWLWLAVTAYWWMALYATQGRGTLMGMAAAGIAVALLARRRGNRYLRQAVLTAALGLLAYVVVLVAVPAVAGISSMHSLTDAVARTAADPASGRTLLWHRAASLIAQHPWLGVGPMHFAHEAGDLHIGAHPHDWLFQVAAEWGLPALLCLLIAIGLGLRALLRAGARVSAGDTDNQTIFAAFLAGAVAVLVDGLVSGIFVMPQSELATALYLGCAIGWQRSIVSTAAAAAANVPRRARQAIGMAGAVAAMVVAVAAVWPDVPAKMRGDPLSPAEQARNAGGHLWPRLWQAGYF